MFRLVKNEGVKTVAYRAGQVARRKADDDKRYARLLKKNRIISGRPIKSEGLDKFAQNLNNIDILVIDEIDNLKKLIAESNKEYVGILEKGVIVRDDALLYVDGVVSAKKDNEVNIDIYYTDEDRVDDRNKRCNPIFKPEISIDTLLSFNYIGDFWCARKDLLIQTLDGMDLKAKPSIKQVKYELLLRMILGTGAVARHIECVAVTRSLDEYITNDYIDMKKMVFNSIGLEYEQVFKYNIVYTTKDNPLVSVIIPTKDHPNLLSQCVESFVEATQYPNYELIIVDNGSSEDNKKKNVDILERSGAPYMYVYKPMDFNFSAMCNTGASKANGEYLLFLNDDIEIIKVKGDYDWLSILVGQASRSWTGATGVKLLYPGKKEYQHLGLINLREYGFDHIYRLASIGADIKDYRDVAMYNYIAVTGACLMVSKEKFLSVGGFDIDLAVTHNDVDLCLKLYENGWYSVIRNDIEFVHHESASRGEDDVTEESLKNNLSERELFLKKHPWINRFDPYYSKFYSSEDLDCGINANIKLLERSYLVKSDLDVNKLANMDVRVREEDRLTDVATITYARMNDIIRITGYAYVMDSNGKANALINPELVIYNKDNCYSVRANSICDRTFGKQKGLEGNLNFAPFVCEGDFSKTRMEKGVYRVAVFHKGNIIGESVRLENL